MSARRETNPAKTRQKLTYATPALDKGLDVIELLARQPTALTKSQIARELNRSVSEIFRMLVCLERRGYIAQIENERYSLTLRLFQLVQEYPPTERLIVDALPVMQLECPAFYVPVLVRETGQKGADDGEGQEAYS
jgi:hypothetical protein